MVDEARGPSGPEQRSAVVSDGTYQVEARSLWLRAPAEVKLEPVTEVLPPGSGDETAQLGSSVDAEPTPEEIARQEAEKLVEQARQEAEELKRQAREQGYTDGLKEGTAQGQNQGREEGRRELTAALERWLTMGDALTEAWRSRFEGLEREVKDLAVAAAEKIVHTHVASSPETVLGVIKDALRHAADAERVTVLVNPKDLNLVREASEELAGQVKGTDRFEIVEAERVEPGSCIVETRSQVIDATARAGFETLSDTIHGSKREPR